MHFRTFTNIVQNVKIIHFMLLKTEQYFWTPTLKHLENRSPITPIDNNAN